jgi:oxygen-independent coproporphyrinogen-3 oxidase
MKKAFNLLLYIHIPYCDSKCNYCSFNSYVGRFDTKELYIKQLKQQLIFELDRFEVQPDSITSIFIGGGTPSCIDARFYSGIFDIISRYLRSGAEITTEANPNSATKEWLKGMRELGVNRVSFGVQSFDEAKLKSLARAHNKIQAINAIENAFSVGFENISLDLIYNHQNDTKELLQNDIEIAFKLPINHISAYELSIEDGTKFALTPNVKQDNENLAFFVNEQITKNGFEHYEISNYGRYKSIHNIGYWRLQDYIGVGSGAVGMRNNQRFYPTPNLDAYLQNPLQCEIENLSSSDIIIEKIFLGFRSLVGVDSSILDANMLQRAKILLDEEKLQLRDGIFYNDNYFLADEIALYILG